MSNYVLDKAYRVVAEAGIEAGIAVVREEAAGECGLPTGANAGNVLGITTHRQPRNGRHIGVRRIGIAVAVAAGAIDHGDRVCIADATGRIARLENPTFATGSVGANNALRFEWLDPASFSANLELVLEVTEDAAEDFAWRFEDHQLVLTLTRAASATTETATSLREAIAADATLSRVLRVSHIAGSSGEGVLAAASARVSNLEKTVNPIGVAETAATAAGDLVDVFLNL